MTVMAGAIISPALPLIKEAFSHIAQAEFLAQLLLTLPGFFIAVGAPIVGVLVDRVGRIKLLLASLIIYGLLGSAGFYLNSLYLILISRAFLGLSVAGIMTITNTLSADYFEGTERSRFVSMRGGFVALGGVVFVSLAGFLSEISWRVPFLLYTFALLMAPLAYVYLYEPESSPAKSSNSGTVPDYPRRWVMMVYGIAFLGMLLFYMIPVHMPFYLKEMIGVDDWVVGLSIGVAMLFGALSALSHSYVKARTDFNGVYSLCFLMMGLCFLIISFSNNYWGVLFGMMLGGVGIGMIGPNHALCLMESAPAAIRGRVLGSLTTFVFLGQFSTPFLGEFLDYFTHSLRLNFSIVSLLLLLLSTTFLLNSGLIRHVLGSPSSS